MRIENVSYYIEEYNSKNISLFSLEDLSIRTQAAIITSISAVKLASFGVVWASSNVMGYVSKKPYEWNVRADEYHKKSEDQYDRLLAYFYVIFNPKEGLKKVLIHEPEDVKKTLTQIKKSAEISGIRIRLLPTKIRQKLPSSAQNMFKKIGNKLTFASDALDSKFNEFVDFVLGD